MNPPNLAQNPITYTPIGVIRTPFTRPEGMPIQSVAAAGVVGTLELDPVYCGGLKDLSEFSHLILIYHLHLMQGFELEVTPFLDDTRRGIFATRSPRRPNPIGLSVVKLLTVEACRVYIEEIDVVDGTPLLDIKPYVPTFDARSTDRIGWFTAHIDQVYTTRADDRFRSGRSTDTV